MDILGITVIVAVLGLGVLVSGLVISRRASKSLIEERLGIAGGKTAQATTGARSTPIGDALDRALTSRGVGSDLATRLARADLKITVGEFIAATIILVIGAGVLSYLWRRNVVVTAGACLVAFFAPRFYVGFLCRQRFKRFNNQLGDTINLMVNGIRAGYSIMQSMEAVSQEMGPPICIEYGRVVQEVQLGVTLEHAMNNMLRRVPSDDLDMMITAINVQREVGGNLAEVLNSISFTIRERVRIKGEIRAMSAQSRISGYMVGMVPVALAAAIYLINPAYIEPMFSHICGYIMIVVAVLGIILGFVVINKVMQIEV